MKTKKKKKTKINFAFLRTEQFFWILLVMVAAAALIGSIVILYGHQSRDEALFIEMLAFIIAVLSVVLGTLGAINNIKQTKSMNKALRDLRVTAKTLEEVLESGEEMEKKINTEHRLLRQISEDLDRTEQKAKKKKK